MLKLCAFHINNNVNTSSSTTSINNSKIFDVKSGNITADHSHFGGCSSILGSIGGNATITSNYSTFNSGAAYSLWFSNNAQGDFNEGSAQGGGTFDILLQDNSQVTVYSFTFGAYNVMDDSYLQGAI